MPTQKPRVTFTISEEALARVEDFRFSNKMKNQTQAILRLIELGLSDYLPTPDAENIKSTSLQDGDDELLILFHKLDNRDQGRILGRMEEMLEADKYKEEAI